jgi:uncharacterized protein YbjT (DUF2867 family)
MQKIIILGANGLIARFATDLFLERTDAHLTLYLRNSSRLKNLQSERVTVMEGDVLDLETLKNAIAGQDIVYANLDGQLVEQARNVVEAMNEVKVGRLIWISSMGIYDEVPGEQFGTMLEPYRKSAALVEASDLDYTVLRPAWLNNDDEIDYETTQKNEPFKGAEKKVSRKSVADLVVRLTQTPGLHYRESLGVNKP